MGKIFKNMVPYWYAIIAIILLLTLQAFGDLSLPQYTSDIIDVGIQNSGIEHILPEKITKEEYNLASMYMTDKESTAWKNSYTADGDIYTRNDLDEDQLNSLDDQLMTPIVLTYKMANMSEADFKDMITKSMKQNPQTAAMADKVKDMSVDEIASVMKIKLHTFQAENKDKEMITYVDMRPLAQQMITSGQMTKDTIQQTRNTMEDMMAKIGSTTIKSMGVAYAISCDKAAGVDVDHIQMTYLWKEAAKMFALAFMMLVAAVIAGFIASKVAAKIGRKLRSNIFSKVVSFSNAEMDKFSTASLITRSTNDIQQIQMVTVLILRMILYAPILGIGGIIKVYQTGAGMGWIIGFAVAIIVAFVLLLVSIAMPKFKAMQTLVDAVNLVSREILTGLSVIRAFGRQKTEEHRFDEANKNLTKTQLFTSRVMTFMMPGMMLIMYGVVILIVWVSAHRIDTGNLQVGAMTAFITYAMQIVMAFLMLTMLSIMLPRAGVASDRIDEVLRTDSLIKDPKEPKKLTSQKGVIRFSHVNFKYPGAEEDVLEDIDFVAEPGKTTAIIGSTGCGKSTLVNLIPRFYDVTEGQITLDGEDIREISMEDLRKGIGFVPQKGILFSGTVASNLRFGKEDATDAEIEEAAGIAQATDFIEEKNEKYESSISQGGSNVSGGQKQRLAIARAIIKNPKVFIFDDSFSALDMKTDVILRKALEEKVKESTVIIVAQRISTILHADQILVIDDGKIVGKGTHEELLYGCEVYQQIATSQLSEKELGMDTRKEERSHE